MYHIYVMLRHFLMIFFLPYLTIIILISRMFHHEGHHSINGIPQGMKSYPMQFSRIPYYENL